MSTANIMNNLNFLPSSAKPVEKEQKEVKEVLVTQAKFWRYVGSKHIIQPTGGFKPATRTAKATSKPLNFERIYIAHNVGGTPTCGGSVNATTLNDLIKLGTMPHLVEEVEAYLAHIASVDASLTPEQRALLA